MIDPSTDPPTKLSSLLQDIEMLSSKEGQEHELRKTLPCRHYKNNFQLYGEYDNAEECESCAGCCNLTAETIST